MKAYIVETRKTKRDKWSLRRYLFTSKREALHQAKVCRQVFGYYGTLVRVWAPRGHVERMEQANSTTGHGGSGR